ncbi:MAG: polymorphic toxin-type HINT domain-containing protein, partial [Myxococcales bacterium]|nr:polymorphic toxin-type HINT domain-containing protein [Myxococcales bacterium]
MLFEDAQRHAPYALTIGVRYHPIHETIVASSPWVRTAGARAPPLADVLGDDDGEARYRYDDFGRLVAVASPGDRLDTPTASFDYQLRAPVSRIIHRRRSRAGGPADLEEIKCFDGMGRSIQTRKRIAEGKYQVSGLIAYNRQGKQAVAYQPYFEADGRCDRSAPADGHKTETTYDALGRVLTLTHPDADLFDGNSVARTHYEPLREIERDPEDADAGSEHADTPLITERDGLGRTVALTRHLVPGDPIGLAFFYDGFGNLHGVRDGHGNEKWQFHDALGRITEVRDPDAGVTTYRRDGRGNAVAITDGRGETTNNRYDEASRLVATWDAQDEAGTRVDLSYDVAPTDCEACSHVAGRLGFATYSLSGASLGLDAYGYDRRGRTTYRARTLDGHTFETRVRFDNADRPVATTYPGGHVLERRFDGVDRVVAVPGFVLDMGYAAHGPVETLALDNGVTTRHRYDDRGRLAGMETELVGRRAGAQQSTSLQAYRYLRDRVGNIIAVGDGLKGGGRPSAEARYRYDALYRLVEAHLDPLDGEHAERLGYRYDTLDNLLERSSDREDTTVAVGRFEYGQGLDAAGDPAGPHAATRLGETKIVYDAAGHVLAQGDRGFGWDHAGRLTEVTRDGQLVSELDYGHGSQRVKKAEDGHVTYYVGDGFEVRDGVATLYVEVAGQRVARVEYADAPDLPDLAPVRVEPEVEHERDIEHEPDGSINAADAWVGRAVAAGVFASDTEVSADDVRAIRAASARQLVRGPEARVTFFHHDHLGTTVLSTDIEGRVLQRSAHYPYGGVRSASGYLEDYAFTGAEYDRQSDLSYHSARYLSPALGRWSAPDPLFATLSANTLEHPFEAANPYAYARNNPVLRVDAQGELAFIPLIFLAVNVADRAYAAYEAYQIYKDIRSGRTTLAKLVKGRARDKLEERVGGVVFGKLGGLAARGLSWLRKNRGRARRDAPDKESKNGGCNCFAAGTLVQTADGLQPIEQLSVGDRVLSKDPKTGAEDVRRVTRTFITPNRPVLKLELAGADGDHTDQVIHATPGHPFWLRAQGFRPAADLPPGTEL